MVSASPPLHDVRGAGHALMEVMRGTAVSVWCSNSSTLNLAPLMQLFTNICTVSCSGFRCNNLQCVRSSDHCDGTRDCTDGSDEFACRKLSHFWNCGSLFTVELCLADTPQQWTPLNSRHPQYNRQFWKSWLFLYRLQYIRKPSLADSLLFRITNTFCSPNCT